MTPEQADDLSGKSSFAAAMKAAGIEQGDPQSFRRPAGEAKPEVKAKEPEKPAETEFDPVMGIVPKKEEEAKPEEIDYSILDKRPEGQIKHDHFSKVQAIAKGEREQRLAIEKRIAEYEAKAKEPIGLDEATKGKLSEYEKAVKERDEILAKVAFEQTPQFKERFVKPEASLRGQIETTLKELGQDSDMASTLLAMGSKKRYEALEGMDIPQAAVADLTGILRAHDNLQRDKSEAIADSHRHLTAYQEEQKGAAEAESKRRMEEENQIFMRVGEKVSKEYEPFMRIEGNADWNSGVDERNSEALKYLHGEKSFEDLSEIVRYGVGAKFQHDKIVMPLRAKVNELTERVSKLTAVSPGARPQTDTKAPVRKMSADEEARETFRREMGQIHNNGFQP